jgi:hypothetical protein
MCLLFSKSTKEVFNVHYANMLPTMIHGQAFRIITKSLLYPCPIQFNQDTIYIRKVRNILLVLLFSSNNKNVHHEWYNLQNNVNTVIIVLRTVFDLFIKFIVHLVFMLLYNKIMLWLSRNILSMSTTACIYNSSLNNKISIRCMFTWLIDWLIDWCPVSSISAIFRMSSTIHVYKIVETRQILGQLWQWLLTTALCYGCQETYSACL